jgi:outer membrane protein OmpA-like peptidoglycan-associated protein
VEDIAQGLALPRGTRIEALPPPTVRLPVFFETDSAKLTPSAEQLLAKLSSAVNRPELSGFRFSIEGHTDDVGTDAYNQGLSQRRAAAVQAYLVAQGVASSKLRAVGKGERSPAVANDGPEGRQRNRRVEVINLGE